MYVRQIELIRGRRGSMELQGDQVVTPFEVPHCKMGSAELRAEFDDGGEVFREKARNELRETPEVVEQSLNDLRNLLKGEPDLNLSNDEEFLQKFLRPCKWYPKSCFELMKRFYRFRANNPRYYANLLPSVDKKSFANEIVIPLPERTKDGCRLLLINCGKQWNLKTVCLDEIFRGVMLSLDAAMAEPKTQIAGVHVIINVDGFSLSHVTQFTPSFAATVTEWVQRCLPCRLKGIHVVNQPFIFQMVFALFKPFLMEKTRKRLHFHGNNRTPLVDHLGTKCLPTELGGDFKMPNEPIGQGICDYFCAFEEQFAISNKMGYVVKRTK